MSGVVKLLKLGVVLGWVETAWVWTRGAEFQHIY